MSNRKATCKQCGKHMNDKRPGEEYCFTFCSDECKEGYKEWLKQHEEKWAGKQSPRM